MFEHINFDALLAQYGYWAVFVGCLLEGESVLILAGMIAHQHILKLYPVIGVAAVGGILGDQFLYWIGRRYGTRLLPKLRRHAPKIDRARTLIKKYPTISVFAVRFLYGMRLVGPMVIGASGLSPWRFLLVNVVGALVWATLFAVGGYWAGEFLQSMFGNLRPYLWRIVLAVLVIFAGIKALEYARAAHKRKRAELPVGKTDQA